MDEVIVLPTKEQELAEKAAHEKWVYGAKTQDMLYEARELMLQAHPTGYDVKCATALALVVIATKMMEE